MRAWLTSDVAAADIICRRFSIPVNLIGYFMGALEELTYSKNWERYELLTPDEDADLFLGIVNSYQDGCMVGTVFSYITDAPPAGSLALDGSTYNNVDYPKLVDAGISQWDNGDGTFTLPDSSGRTIVGAGAGAGLTARSLGDTFGVESVTLTIAEMPEHEHDYEKIVPTLIDPGVTVSVIGIDDINTEPTGSTGGGGAHENMQPSLVFPLAVWAS